MGSDSYDSDDLPEDIPNKVQKEIVLQESNAIKKIMKKYVVPLNI